MLALLLPLLSIGSFDACDALFRERPATLALAETCYTDLSETLDQDGAELAARLAVRESLFEVYAWMVDATYIKDPKEWAVPSMRALKHVDRYLELAPESATGLYWKAVFTSTEARSRDPKVGPPLATLKVIYPVIDLLKASDLKDETVHGFGPARVLGVILGELPPLFKGDKKAAEAYFRRAMSGAPHFSATRLELGRLFVKMKRRDEARALLSDLIAEDPLTLDPNRIPETKRDQESARALLANLP